MSTIFRSLTLVAGSALLMAGGLSRPAAAQEPGDSPLTVLYQNTGLLDLAHAVVPLGIGTSGTFTLTGIPGTATVEQAYLILGAWDEIGSATNTLDVTFDGTLFPAQPADVIDYTVEVGGFDLGGYAIDVTALVSGDGSYPLSFVHNQVGTSPPGALLAVVFSDPGNPLRQVSINFGAEQIRFGSASTDIPGLVASSGDLYVWTEADNAFFSGPVEEILFNGLVIAGGAGADIFNGNQGAATSFFAFPGLAIVDGTNTVAINNGQDLFGWHYAAIVSDGDEPTSIDATTWGRVKSLHR